MNLSDIQRTCLDVFKYFKKIADYNNLSYFGIGGTCIGAIRHNGFIPWDDDIDIAMPYEDYKKFVFILKKMKSNGIELYSPFEHKHFTGSFFKLNNSNTTFIEKANVRFLDSYKGIGIDIMPIFGLPKGEMSQFIFAKKVSALIRINDKLRSPFDGQKSILSKMFWLSVCPLKVYKNNNLILHFVFEKCSKYSIDNSDKILFAWRRFHTKRVKESYKSVFYYKDFASYIEVPFEDTTMRIPIGWDNYLRMDFGDYMQLPPIEKRVAVHNAVLIDTHKSYKEYIGKL